MSSQFPSMRSFSNEEEVALDEEDFFRDLSSQLRSVSLELDDGRLDRVDLDLMQDAAAAFGSARMGLPTPFDAGTPAHAPPQEPGHPAPRTDHPHPHPHHLPPPAAAAAPLPSRSTAAPAPDEAVGGKLFIGGLSWSTTPDSLRVYFAQYGSVSHCRIMRDPATGKSRGFGFVTFIDPAVAERVAKNEAQVPYALDGRRIDPKLAVPKSSLPPPSRGRDASQESRVVEPNKSHSKKNRLFVGGLSQLSTVDNVRACFEQYGRVAGVVLMYDRVNKRPRGFGFVTFTMEQPVSALVAMQYVSCDGKMVECKRAEPKAEVEPDVEPPSPRIGSEFHPSAGNPYMGGSAVVGAPGAGLTGAEVERTVVVRYHKGFGRDTDAQMTRYLGFNLATTYGSHEQAAALVSRVDAVALGSSAFTEGLCVGMQICQVGATVVEPATPQDLNAGMDPTTLVMRMILAEVRRSGRVQLRVLLP
eukprot:m.79444 g.79444  ORF g.79444 m.79444 type:complete len:472 (+) comp19296_c0_seq1:844-2259(+)